MEVSDKISYPLNFAIGGQDLLIAFDVGNGSQRILRRPVLGALAFVGNNKADAAKKDRGATGYNTVNNFVYCVEKIELA
jgi:hypothetical protein